MSTTKDVGPYGPPSRVGLSTVPALHCIAVGEELGTPPADSRPEAAPAGYCVALGARLKELRAAANLPRVEVVRATGISRNRIAKWEIGQSKPSLQRLGTLADLYGVSLLDILLHAAGSKLDALLHPSDRDAVTQALLAWAAACHDTSPDGSAADFRRSLGTALHALRKRSARRGPPTRSPVALNVVLTFECGAESPPWATLVALAGAYDVRPLALLTYAAATAQQHPVTPLLADGDLTPVKLSTPRRRARFERADATIVPALSAWADARDITAAPRADPASQATVHTRHLRGSFVHATTATPDYCNRLGHLLMHLREQQELTRQTAAESIRVRTGTLREFELGKLRPTLRQLQGLATRYRVGLLSLLVSVIDPESRQIEDSISDADADAVVTALIALADMGGVNGRLAALRTARGLSQVAVGARVTVPPSTITNWETKRVSLTGLAVLAPLYEESFLSLLLHVTSPTVPGPTVTLKESDAETLERALRAWDVARGTTHLARQAARKAPVAEAGCLATLGRTLRHLRRANGWTTETLAKKAKMPWGCISLYELARDRIPLGRLDALCTTFGVGFLACLVHAAEAVAPNGDDDEDPRTSLRCWETVGGEDAAAIRTALVSWHGSGALRRDYRGPRDPTTTVLIGERLRDLRMERGLSIATVAARAGMSQVQVRFIEIALNRATLGQLDAFARQYGMSLLTLLVHATSPTSERPSSRPIGGDDADRIVPALLAWETATPGSTPSNAPS